MDETQFFPEPAEQPASPEKPAADQPPVASTPAPSVPTRCELPADVPGASGSPPPTNSGTLLTFGCSTPTSPNEKHLNLAVPGYEILCELGRGGMGVVYKARQKKTNRVVALKMILGNRHADIQDKVRFQIEVEAIARLQNIHIVQLHEAGEHEDLPFFSLEYCDGGSLDRKLKEKPLSDRDGAELVEKLARAMHYAHVRGVVHRDLKPANVLLTTEGEPKITDFGLAKRMDTDSDVSRSGAIMGTPSYMAPEQAAGKVHTIGPAADVYALGAILYEVLTGRPPFRGETAFDTIRQVLNDDPMPPSRVQPNIALDLETICLHCLQKNPPQRYASAEALADDCRRFLAGEPIQARPVGRVERAIKWVKRRPVIAALSGLIVLLTTGAMIGISWGYHAARHERDRAVAAETDVRQLLVEARERERKLIQTQVDQLLTADPQSVKLILASLKEIDPEAVRPRLLRIWNHSAHDRLQQMRAGMALLSDETTAVKQKLAAWMLETDKPRETLLLRDVLEPYKAELTPWLWKKVVAAETSSDGRFRAYQALATYDPINPCWQIDGEEAATQMLKAEHPVLLQLWTDALFPIRDRLYAPLVEVFRGQRLADRRLNAAKILAVYLADRPEQLTEMVGEANAEQFAVLQAPLEKQRARVTELLKQEIARTATASWQDKPLDPAWPELTDAWRHELEEAGGMVAERFALCQTLALNRAPALVEALRKSGYHPIQYRPFKSGVGTQLAAVWTRDGADFQLAQDVVAETLRQQDEEWRGKGYLPLDVASYFTEKGLRHAALWTRKDAAVLDARLYVGVSAADHAAAWQPLNRDGLVPRTQAQVDGAGGPWHSGVWWKPAKVFESNLVNFRYDEKSYAKNLTPNRFQTDVRLEKATPPVPQSRQERFGPQLDKAEAALREKPDDGNLRWQRAQALIGLGRHADALPNLDAAALKFPRSPVVFRQRAIECARLGRAAAARADLAFYCQLPTKVSQQANLDAHLAALLGDEVEGMKRLEAALAAHAPGWFARTDSSFLYDAAHAYALAAEAIDELELAHAASLAAFPGFTAPLLLADLSARAGRPAAYAERAVDLLRQAVAAGYQDFAQLAADDDLAYLRRQPGFRALLEAGHLDRRYRGVWHESDLMTSAEAHALDPAALLARCRQLADEGYRPASLTVAEIVDGQPLLSACVWHRPILASADRVALARRQANDATALLYLGQAEAVWPLLRHSATPDLRSYLVRDLAPLGTSIRVLAKQLEEESDVSARRALILALGEFSAKDVPDDVRETLVPQLLDWYRYDPDPGVHGAIDWLLRHARQGPNPRKFDWGEAASLRAADADLMKDPVGDRRWFVSKSGQTFAVIPGPVEFTMGSPSNEQGRHWSETLHQRVIPHSYAIATTKVTVAQFRRFKKDVQTRFPGVMDQLYQVKFSPDDDGPIIFINWYDAAMYCRWLSEQEGIPEDQMCYPPIPEIKPGVQLPKNFLSRTGYRMPTQGEWEYACRAGASTSRFFGDSDELLPNYAWYVKNSQDRAWPVGQLKPNDFGLFDMMGNVYDHAQDLGTRSAPDDGPVVDTEFLLTAPQVKDNIAVQGGSYMSIASAHRSAAALSNTANARPSTYGFRVVRTWP